MDFLDVFSNSYFWGPIILGLFIAWIVLAIAIKAHAVCPHCKMLVDKEAAKCPHCQSQLQ